jgi:hypothetical protein
MPRVDPDGPDYQRPARRGTVALAALEPRRRLSQR